MLAGCGGGRESAQTTTAAAGGCREATAPEPRENENLKPPPGLLQQGVEQRIQVATSCGTFTITVTPKAAPHAAASFAELAKIGFFDGLSFHRIVPGFVIQGGDPTGMGGGGPGYTTVDTPAHSTTYPRGTVAMAKAPAEPPGSAGSQFFVVIQDAPLPPDYAVIGTVTEGMQTVDRIAALGNRATELPKRPVVIDRMTLETG